MDFRGGVGFVSWQVTLELEELVTFRYALDQGC